MVTQWKPVPGYEDLYQVSDRGRVRRIAGGSGTHVGHVLRPNKDIHGYPKVDLCRNGHAKTRRVHALVAQAFLGPCSDGMEVNHDNGIKEDNRVGNLEYMTHGENVKHSRDVLRRGCGEAHGRAKLTNVIVREIRQSYAEGGVTQRKLAKRYDISEGHMSQILHRKKWAHVA